MNTIRRFTITIAMLLGITASIYAIEPMVRVALQNHSQRWQEESDKMAFLNNTWQAVMDGNFANTNNWSLGIVPVGNHIAIFDGTTSQSVTTGLDRSGATMVQVLVKPSYSGNIGSQGNPLRLDLGISGPLVWRGSGQGFVHLKNGNFTNVVVDVPRVRHGANYNLVIGGMGTGTAGNVHTVAVKRGNVNLMGDMHVSGESYILGDAARLVMDPNLDGMSEPDHIFCAAGILINSRPLAANTVLIVGDRSRVTQIGALPATVRVVVIGNGKFEYLPTSAPGTSPLLSVIGGVYDQTDEKWTNVWGTTIIGPDASIIGGALRGTNIFPASLDLREDYPGAQE